MERKVLAFIALAVTMLWGVGFSFVDNDAYASVGGVVVALLWIAVGVFGRGEEHPRRATRA